MKRGDLLRHIESYGCRFKREGQGYTVYVNPETGKRTVVPRHQEIPNNMAKEICKQLGIDPPSN